MKTFRQLISEVAQPKSEDELNFKDKHEIDFIDHPESEEEQHTLGKSRAKRRADYADGEDMAVYESDLDPVNHKALKGKFKDRQDKDIDNDGDVDDSDEYLHNRRKTISKAMKNESKMSDEDVLDAAKALAKNGKDAKTRNFGRGLVNFHKKEGSFTPEQVGGLQNIMKNASFQMAKEEVELDEAKIKYNSDEAYNMGFFAGNKGYSSEYPAGIKGSKGLMTKYYDGWKAGFEKYKLKNESVTLDETYSVFKPMSPAAGKSVSNRAQVKSFKTSDQMNTFLAKGDNALHWKPTNKQGLKSGTYKMDMKRGADGKPDRDFIRESTFLEENFKQGSLTLDDGSSVLLKKQDADLLNQMVKDLNVANRNKMMNVAMKDKAGFEEILGFAREAL